MTESNAPTETTPVTPDTTPTPATDTPPVVDSSVSNVVQPPATTVVVPLVIYTAIVDEVARVRTAISGARVRGMDVYGDVLSESVDKLESYLKGAE